MDIFSSSVTSIEGHNFALIITDDCTGYRWLYGLKTKDDILKAIKKWHSDIAELRETHTVIMVMRDNAGENKSKEIVDFLESPGIESRYSTPYEQWQNGQAESSINSLMTLARSVMVESGLGGKFCFSSAMMAKDARNVTYKERIKMAP
jgi:transposase InsO family protein